jgi:hypothetical protein
MFKKIKRLFLLHFGTLKQLEQNVDYINENYSISEKLKFNKIKAIKKIEKQLDKQWKKTIKRKLKYSWHIDRYFSLDLSFLSYKDLRLFKDKEKISCKNGKYMLTFYVTNEYQEFAAVDVNF